MSGSGLSKADREIVAQNAKLEEQRANAKRLFGREEGTDILTSLPGTFGKEPSQSKESTSSGNRRGRSQSVRPLPGKKEKGKMPEKWTFQYEPEKKTAKHEPESKSNYYPTRDASNANGASWDTSLDEDEYYGVNTLLDWADLQWKPHYSAFFKGHQNWFSYKEALLLQLRSIGYRPRMKLTSLDEVKLAALIQRTSTSEAALLVSGMTKGTEIMMSYEATYRQVGELQQESLYQKLMLLRYKGGCPVLYVTATKTAVKEYQSAGGEMVQSQIKIQFKQSVKDKASRWHSTVSAVSRFQNWELEHLYQYFTSNFYDRIGLQERGAQYPHPKHKNSSKGSIKNTHHNSKTDVSKNAQKEKESKRNIRCYKCKKMGHYASKCPEGKRKGGDEKPCGSKGPNFIDPPAALNNEYCSVPDEELSGYNNTAQVRPQTYQEMVEFYEKEMAKKRGEMPHTQTESGEHQTEITTPGGEIGVTQQIMKVGDATEVKDRWLFDTGADIDATNQRKNFRPGKIVNLGPKQFPIRTGNGVVYAECVGEVWLPLRGKNNEKKVMRIKYTLYLKNLPVNIISGERFYKSDGYLNRNQLIDHNGTLIAYIDTLRRGFFLWLYDQEEPLKSITPKRMIHHTSSTDTTRQKISSSSQIVDIQVLKETYMVSWVNGTFTMSDHLMKQLVLWHRRLCHPNTARMRWTISNTVGIDIPASEVENLPCEACDMGKSLKYVTSDRRTRMKNVGEGWHCDVETLNPTFMEGFKYFCLTTDVSRYRIFRALKQKSEESTELKAILSKVNTDLRQKHNPRVRQVVIDGERDWGLNSFQEFAQNLEIEVIISAPNNQYQNGVSERGIKFIQDAARCCSIQMKVPSIFWNHMLEMVCYTLNRTSQSPVRDHKTPHEVYWLVMDDQKMTTDIGHLWIPGTLCITHVDASNRIAGEKLEANGTRSVFMGYKGTKNKLVWLLDGGRFLISPQVTAHENVGPGLGWAADPREIVRSLPKHVQERLKRRMTIYARNEDFNQVEESSPHPLLPRGRGRPKKTNSKTV